MSQPSKRHIWVVVLVVFAGIAAGVGITPDAFGAPPPCDDGNPCTDDSGHPNDCVHSNNEAPCNDGNACTTVDTCSGGSCVGGTPVVCVAPDLCHVPGTCNPISGDCSDAQPIPEGGACSDLCTNPGTCIGGNCQGASARCNDNDGCTDDSCNPSTGACLNTPKNCDDGNLCTVDYCSVAFCYHSPTCSDSNPCTNDTCNPSTGACTHTPNTGNTCGDDGDGNVCTANRCNAGVCQPSALSACDDLNPCTADACNPQAGLPCSHVSLVGSACNDGNACTVNDTCTGFPQSTGCVGTYNPSICEDGNPCTTNSCQPSTGCVSTFNQAPCDDGNACTANDTCSGGACVPGVPINAPTEVTNVRFESLYTLTWDTVANMGPGTTALIARGLMSTLPTGANDAECFSQFTEWMAQDPYPDPAVGQALWYLVRARNSCGIGTWGSAASHGIPTTPRNPTGALCP